MKCIPHEWLRPTVIALLSVVITAAVQAASEPADLVESNPTRAAEREAELVTHVRQLTFEGRRAGEGYFSADGRQMVFQSEREPGNPFFQIYLMDLNTGDIDRVSPGIGKTTCAWIHPDAKSVLFASTHEDPQAKQKQTAEIELRQSGKQRRYAWDYDEHYDIFVFNRDTGRYTNLTNTQGYDAEGSWSPDGQLIAFTSNREAYRSSLTDEQKEAFDRDPAVMNDIYLMNSDGGNVRRLTKTPGYDGGPFFSPDGRRICWRRFQTNGAVAEIMTMNIDGSDQRQLTHLGVMSWAPFYHPSGDYLIFTTNRHGFANFELYLVDVQGQSEPVRVTYTAGFDGLPVFSPDGKKLAWTSKRTQSKQSQLFLADWNDQRARELLGLTSSKSPRPQSKVTRRTEANQTDAVQAAATAFKKATADFSPDDIRRHVAYLCRRELEGRLTGTRGEKLATAYVAAYFEKLGLQPAGSNNGWFQDFTFTSGVALGKRNRLQCENKQYAVGTDWTPVAFSAVGEAKPAPVVMAGYGLVVPEAEDQPEYDSFVHLDVKDKWVMVFRYMPEDITPERRQQFSRYSGLRYKTMIIRDRGARGLILVSGPNSKVKSQLVPMQFDGSLAGTSIPVISVTDAVANEWLERGGKQLKTLQDKLDAGDPVMGFELKNVTLSARIDVRQIKQTGRNVLGRLPVGSVSNGQIVVVGAHVDHLGKGFSSSSLARDTDKESIHFGADDNASGVAAMLDIAEFFAHQQTAGTLKLKRDILFAAWSGEELGLLGSSHFVKTYQTSTTDMPHSRSHDAASQSHSLYPAISTCLNLDMVGRLQKKLILQGAGSSSIWRGEVERRNIPVGLPVTLQNDSYLPTDASSFFMRGVPILSAFTGTHSDYHTPRDTPEKLNYDGAAKIAKLMALLTRSVARRDTPPDYVAQTRPKEGSRRANLRAYLGTIPDYAESDVKGVKLSGVAKDGPADKAGVRGGDIVVELAGKKIENIYDYTYAIEALKIGQTTTIVVQRGDEHLTLSVTPGSRE